MKKPLTPEQQKRRNRRVLLTVAAIFVLPLAAAQLVLKMGWYEPGVSNKGNLVSPEIQLTESSNALLPNKWRIAYVVPAECQEQCGNALYVASQLYHALGKQQDRVRPVGIQGSQSATQLPTLPADSNLQYVLDDTLNAELRALPEHSLFIIDPVGNVVLWYATSDDRQATILQGRDLLSDLQKLLKLSRVG
ncbi:hypothetical protein [Aliidiomarina haloalkalitolerans]|uniref:Cytochrome oxidase assembly protein n=1 Tax=Aliidiomarina haloalkalitolerans TaxID=859059 RepID=A0A432VVK7_9GAMM|nr:hypothetical protein [Aliidiomarina haloalkalitolerans]RUO20593.1 hypothetical protein CWE06_04580 [Aliidiomarina haloalkalitolerans]